VSTIEHRVLVVDDYGHHPTEIAAVLAAARATLGRRLVVVGTGPEAHRLRAMAGPSIEFLGWRSDAEVAGLAAKIDREEAYHRLHAEMWHERLRNEPRYVEALEELRPLVDRRDGHTPELAPLWEEMTSVRRSQPAGTVW